MTSRIAIDLAPGKWSMRKSLLLIVFTSAVAACGRSEPERFTLYQDKVERVNGCHIVMDFGPGRGKIPFAGIRYVCDAPESVKDEKNWWGDKPQPLSFTMSEGDCLILGDTFYCVEHVELGEATFKAAYKWATRHHDRIELIR